MMRRTAAELLLLALAFLVGLAAAAIIEVYECERQAPTWIEERS
jgi:hypothetical protein